MFILVHGTRKGQKIEPKFFSKIGEAKAYARGEGKSVPKTATLERLDYKAEAPELTAKAGAAWAMNRALEILNGRKAARAA